LIVGPERGRLERLEERAPVSPETVGAVLPEAIATSIGRRADETALALEPPLTTALRRVAHREADMLGEILSPTIGAAVKKAVADAVAVMMQRMDEALARSCSIESIRWRIEAKRTSRPFAEVLLLHTLVYRVEEVFLVHPHTGMVLESVASSGAKTLNPDQVASMLEAIEAFVHDAFAPVPGTVHVGRIDFGDMFLWVDRSSQAAVVALVRGVAPAAFSEQLREARERIVLSMHEELARFKTNVTPFGAARPTLESCLQQELKKPPTRAKIWFAAIAAMLLLGATLLVALHQERSNAEQRALDATVTALTAEPGLVVTSAERSHGKNHVRGLRDPLARSPDEVLAAHRLPRADVAMAPYVSLDPAIVEQRARQKLPDEIAGLRVVTVSFPVGSSDEHGAVNAAAATIRARELMNVARDARVPTCITVVGHADSTGKEAENKELSEARANAIANELVENGIPRDRVRAIGIGMSQDGLGPSARSVTFEVGMECEARP
jgi:OOP family OmpA-OmpF porin